MSPSDLAAVLPELEWMSRERRLDERMHGQLMLALSRIGRRADGSVPCLLVPSFPYKTAAVASS